MSNGFSSKPTAVKIAVALTFYNSFVFFEELVIDRYGIAPYLPFYKVGMLCVWDLAAMIAIGWFLVARIVPRRHSDTRGPSATPTSVKLAVGLMYLNAFALALGILERYEVLSHVPPALLLLLLLAIPASTVAWLLRRPPAAATFRGEPLLVKVASGVALYNAILFLEYFVIHPSGIWRYLPLYRAAGASPWDVAVPLAVGVAIWMLGFRAPRRMATSPESARPEPMCGPASVPSTTADTN